MRSNEYTDKSVHSGIHLFIKVATLALSIFDGSVNKTLVARLVRCSEDKRGVGRGILRLVDIDRCWTRGMSDI